MTEPKSVFIERCGVRLHALDHGGENKPVLLLLHGAAAHAHWWDRIAPEFGDLFRPVAPDLRGHGDSDWAEDYSYDALEKDLEAWIQWAGRETNTVPAVLAHSLGGVIAVKLYEGNMPNLLGLLVADAPLDITDRITEEARGFGHKPSRPWPSAELFIEKFRLIPSNGKADPAEIARIARHSIRAEKDGTWVLKTDRAFHRSRAGTALRSGWKKVRAPAKLLVGGQSDRLLPEDLEWIRRACPHVEVARIEDAGHHLFLDDPEAFLRATREFFLMLF